MSTVPPEPGSSEEKPAGRSMWDEPPGYSPPGGYPHYGQQPGGDSGGYGGGYSYAGAGYGPTSPDPMAIGGLASSGLGVLCCCIPGGGIALGAVGTTLGLVSRSRIRRGDYTGEGWAIAAILVGLLAVVLGVGFLVYIVQNGQLTIGDGRISFRTDR